MTTMATTDAIPLAPLPEPLAPAEPVDYADRYVEPLTTRPMPPLLHDEPAGYRWAWLLVGLAVTVLFGVVVFRFYAPADSGVDQNAYLLGGRLIAQHHTTRYVLPVLPNYDSAKLGPNPGGYAYTGGMMVRMPNGDYFPKYPAGLPLLYACFFWIFGPEMGPVYAFVVSPATAVLSVMGTFFLARAVAGSFAAVMAAVLLGTSQVMLSLADNPNSHASCTACIIWGMFLLVRWWQTGSLWQGAASGFLIGYAFTIRYTEGLLVIPIAIACLTRIRWGHWAPWLLSSAVVAVGAAFMVQIGQYTGTDWADVHGVHHWIGEGKTPKAILSLVADVYALAALVYVAVMTGRGLHRAWLTSFLRNVLPGLAWCVPVVTLLIYNSRTMGHAAGYDTTHESELGVAFQWKYLVRNWEMVVRTFDDLELFFVVPFALAGMALVFRRSWRVGLLLVTWLVPGVLLYTSYYWSMDFDVAYARFYLTFLPALCVAAAVAFHDGLLAGRVGGAGDHARGHRPWSPLVQVTAALAVLGAFTLAMQLWHASEWDLLQGARHWIGPGKTILTATAVGLLVYAAAALATVATTAFRMGYRPWAALAGRAPATVAVGMVVAVSAGVSSYRALKGLRDGTENLIPLLENYRGRLNLARVGEHLLGKHPEHPAGHPGKIVMVDNVPARSVLFSAAGGGIQSPSNYIQFLRDWDLYPATAFSEEGSRSGMGGGGGAANRNRGINNRGGGGPGGGGAGRNGGGGGGFLGFGGGGGRNGPPGGGGGPGGGPPGMGNNADDQDTVVATPIQPEQRDYHAGLYRNVTRKQLYQKGGEVVRRAFANGQRVFAIVEKDALETFEDDLDEGGLFDYRPVATWTDVMLPVDHDEDATTANDASNRWGNRMNARRGGGMGAGGGMARLLGMSNQQNDWRLVEVIPERPTAPAKKK